MLHPDRYIGKCNTGRLFHIDLCVGFSDIHHAAHTALAANAAEHKECQQKDQQEGKERKQTTQNGGHLSHIGLCIGNIVFIQQCKHIRGIDNAGIQHDLAGIFLSVWIGVNVSVYRSDIDELIGERNRGDLMIFNHINKIGVEDLGFCGKRVFGIAHGIAGHKIDNDR